MRLFLFPGLGADSELWAHQQTELGDRVVVLDLIAPQQNESLATYAERLFEKLPLREEERAGRVLFGGISFGGQLALELGRITAKRRAPCNGIVLISANRTSDTIPRRFQVNAAIGSLIPDRLMPLFIRTLAPVFATLEGLSTEDRSLLKRIAARTDVSLLRWGVRATVDWKFTQEDLLSIHAPIYQIHGANDPVIPLRGVGEKKILRNARHLINLTHRSDVNSWLADVLQRSEERFGSVSRRM